MKEEKTYKPRKNMMLWQHYQQWNDLVEMRKKHTLRISSAVADRSSMDPMSEQNFIDDLNLDENILKKKGEMIDFGMMSGPVWGWLTSIRGLGAGGDAAKIIAQIDDIEKFATIAKLWRFCGYAVIDGKAERAKRGEPRHYNGRLKGILFIVGRQFLYQHTHPYREIYDEEKERQLELHPEPVKKENGKKEFTKQQLHYRAMRKMIKTFLKDLWIAWRELEGLPLTDPYVGGINE